MASLRKKGNGYEIRFTDRSRTPQQIALYFGPEFSGRIQDLKKRLEQDYKLYRLGKGGRDPWSMKDKRKNPKIPSAVEDLIYHKTVETEEWGENTSGNIQSVLRRFADQYSDLRLQSLSTEHLDNFTNKGGVARATRVSRLKTLKVFLNHFNFDIEDPPIRGNQQTKQVKYILESEANLVNQTIMDKVKSDLDLGYQTEDRNSLWLVNLLTWSFYAGTRPSETLRLRPEDYNRASHEVQIRRKTKNNLDRTLPIGKVKILRSIMDNLTDPGVRAKLEDNPYWKDDRIFGHYDQKRTSKTIKKYIRLAFQDNPHRAEELNWYSYRHGCAVYLLSNGVPIYSVSNWLGHSSVRTTEKYYAGILGRNLGEHIGSAYNGQ